VSDKKILIDLRMIELGLAPESASGKKLRKLLSTIPEEDRRRSKRKFRKMWKKIYRSEPELASSLGAGKEKPSGNNMRNRRAWVRRKIRMKIDQE